MEPDKIDFKVLRKKSLNENFINVICKLFEKCRKCEMIPYI